MLAFPGFYATVAKQRKPRSQSLTSGSSLLSRDGRFSTAKETGRSQGSLWVCPCLGRSSLPILFFRWNATGMALREVKCWKWTNTSFLWHSNFHVDDTILKYLFWGAGSPSIVSACVLICRTDWRDPNVERKWLFFWIITLSAEGEVNAPPSGKRYFTGELN